MSNNVEKRKRGKLSRQLLMLTLADAGISVFVYVFLRLTSEGLVLEYFDSNNLGLTAAEDTALMFWLSQLSAVASVIFFIIIFFVMIGQKLSYIKDITEGIEDLRTHGMNHEIPLKDDNELTSLAEEINCLAETERQLKEMEASLAAEKEALIRDLSHDIRTPLTAIMSYAEYVKVKPEITTQEIMDFVKIVQTKAEQIKVLTDRLLDTGVKQVVHIDDGRLLIAQLCEEWEEILEESFSCKIDLNDCPHFSGEIDIQEIRRIFDNLLSNIEKYGDKNSDVELIVGESDGRLCIVQKNKKKLISDDVESLGIGLESIRRIVSAYGGNLQVMDDEEVFMVKITLFSI